MFIKKDIMYKGDRPQSLSNKYKPRDFNFTGYSTCQFVILLTLNWNTTSLITFLTCDLFYFFSLCVLCQRYRKCNVLLDENERNIVTVVYKLWYL